MHDQIWDKLDRLDVMVSLIADPILTSQLCLILQWTKEDGHRTSTSAVPNLFVPLNTNPKEVQEMRNKVRALAREGGGCRGGGTCAVGQSTLAGPGLLLPA